MVPKFLDLNNIFLTETAIFIVERRKKRMGYRFGPKCKHAQEIHTTVCSDPEILLPWQVDVMTSPLYPLKEN